MSLTLSHTSAPRPPVEPLYLTARYEQLSHIHPKVGASGTATANAFLYQHNHKKYVITSAHTLFSDSMAPTKPDPNPENKNGATMPTEIRLGTTKLAVMGYSRFFDVAILDGTDVHATSCYTSIYNANEIEITDCVAHFEDPNADGAFTTTANARLNINRRTRTGAFFYKLMDGSSGSAISKNGQLVGMVSGCDQQYDNLTVFVPAPTILNLLDRVPTGHPDLDALNVFPKILSAPITKGLKAYFPEKREDGTLLNHVVMYADHHITYKSKDGSKDLQLLPLTLVEPYLADQALKSSQGTYHVKYCPIKEDYREWFRFPREVYTVETVNSNGSSYRSYMGRFVANKDQFKSDEKGKSEFDKVCWNGMNVLSGEYASVTTQPNQINKNDISSDQDLVEIFPISCAYAYLLNSTHIYGTIPLDDGDVVKSSTPITTSTVNINGKEELLYRDSLTPDGYKNKIWLCLVRHWVFLIMSGLKGVPDPGYQFIVFAAECRRLQGFISKQMFDGLLLACTFNTIAEFTDIQAMNFLRILATVFQLTKRQVRGLKTYFPIEEFNQATADYTKWNWGSGDEYAVLEQSTSYPPVFDAYGNCSFNINGLEAEHYKINPTLAQATTAARTDDRATDTVGMELELVYAEMERLNNFNFSATSTDPNYYYYPQSFDMVKSIWDHSHITLGNLLPELSNAFEDA